MTSGVQTVTGEGWRSGLSQENSSCLIQLASLFRTIPPERVGLNGEYDHSGLSKRVRHAFRATLSQDEVDTVTVTQRGAVVILTGKVLHPERLRLLVEIAMTISGTMYVETHGVSVMH